MERRVANGSTSSLLSLSSTASAEGDSVFVAPAPTVSAGNEHSSDGLALLRKQSLERKLLCRRSVSELAEQGIYPPLKSPAAFHEQTRHLERAKTGDILKHKIEHRPDRLALIRQNILDETAVQATLDPSIQARQRQLKKARLLTDLNDRLARRPGPFELVQTHILEPDESVRERLQATFALQEGGEAALEDVELEVEESEDPSWIRLRVAPDDAAPAPPATSAPSRDCRPGPYTSTSSSISPTTSVSSSLTVTSGQSSSAPNQRAAAPKKPPSITSRPPVAKTAFPATGPRVQARQRVNLKFHFYTGPPTKRTERKSGAGPIAQPAASPEAVTPTDTGSPTHTSVTTPSQANYNFQRILEQQTVLLQLQHEAERTQLATSQSSLTSLADEDRRLLKRLDALKVSDLRSELRRRGLRMQGTKPELTDRLRSVLLSHGPVQLQSQSQTSAAGEQPLTCSEPPASVQSGKPEPNANVEALMQQLQHEIECEQVQTRRLAAPQPPCYVLNGAQPVILVNLPVATQPAAPTASAVPPVFPQLPAPFSAQDVYSTPLPPFPTTQLATPPMQRSFSEQPNSMQMPLASRAAQQLSVPCRANRSALVDDVLDILIRSGELSPSAARTPKDVLSSPGTTNILNAMARRGDPSNLLDERQRASGDHCAAQLDPRADASGCHFRFSLPPPTASTANGDAMEYTPAPSPSPLPSVHMDECVALFASGSLQHTNYVPGSADQSTHLGMGEPLSDELLSFMDTANSVSGHNLDPTGLHAHPLGLPPQAHNSWLCGSHTDVDLNSLIHAPSTFGHPTSNDATSTHSAVCDTVRCNR